jgi:hypothetical protein
VGLELKEIPTTYQVMMANPNRIVRSSVLDTGSTQEKVHDASNGMAPLDKYRLLTKCFAAHFKEIANAVNYQKTPKSTQKCENFCVRIQAQHKKSMVPVM